MFIQNIRYMSYSFIVPVPDIEIITIHQITIKPKWEFKTVKMDSTFIHLQK